MSGQIGRNCPSKIRTECCQSLLPMPEAQVLAGVIGPRVGPGSAFGGPGNQRVWMSGVGVWSRRTPVVTWRRSKMLRSRKDVAAARVHHMVHRNFAYAKLRVLQQAEQETRFQENLRPSQSGISDANSTILRSSTMCQTQDRACIRQAYHPSFHSRFE